MSFVASGVSTSVASAAGAEWLVPGGLRCVSKVASAVASELRLKDHVFAAVKNAFKGAAAVALRRHMETSVHDHEVARPPAPLSPPDWAESILVNGLPVEQRGLNILCIDGGGVRGIAPLEILKELRALLGGKEASSFNQLIRIGIQLCCILYVILSPRTGY